MKIVPSFAHPFVIHKLIPKLNDFLGRQDTEKIWGLKQPWTWLSCYLQTQKKQQSVHNTKCF